MADGKNMIDLSRAGLPGASLTFTALIAGHVLTLKTLTIVASADTGVHVTHPIFYATGPTGSPTENDDLASVDQTIAAGDSAPLGTGLLVFEGWSSADTFGIAFTEASTSAAN